MNWDMIKVLLAYNVDEDDSHSNSWELLLRCYYMPCYARRRGLGLRDIHDRCEMLING